MKKLKNIMIILLLALLSVFLLTACADKNQTSEFDPNQIRSKAEAVSYDELESSPENYMAKSIFISGEIVQFEKNANTSGPTYQLKVDGDATKVITVLYIGEIDDEEIKEGDTVTFYGIFGGLSTYESNGQEITIPSMMSYTYDLGA